MLKRFVVLAALAMVLGVVVGPSAAQGQGAPTIYAVTEDNSLIRFSSSAPATITARMAMSGLQPGEAVLGIDFRPANGQLYVLGDSGRLYTINLQTGAATPANSATLALSGVSFGVDFNPVADRLRIVSNDEQNLRVNVETGEATVDGALAYAAGDPNAGVEPTVIAAA